MSIPEKVRFYADLHKADADQIERVIMCESQGRPEVQSGHPDPTGPNGREDSWGLSQIHLPSHPEITREQATDPDFALEFISKEFAAGRSWKWKACLR